MRERFRVYSKCLPHFRIFCTNDSFSNFFFPSTEKFEITRVSEIVSSCILNFEHDERRDDAILKS